MKNHLVKTVATFRKFWPLRSAKSPVAIMFLSLLLVLISPVVSKALTRTSTGTGSWGTAGTWSPSGVPANGDVVIIAATHVVTLNVNTNSLASLTVNGTLTIGNSNTDRTITVTGNVTINNGGVFNTGGNGGNLFVLGGDLVNNGTFDAVSGAATMNTTFNGAASQTVSGTGAVTDFGAITVNSGVATNVVSITSSQFTATNGFLTLTRGVFELSGSYVFSNRIFATAAYTIPVNTGLWINNPNVTVTGQNGDGTVNGLLRISQGTYNVGTVADNDLDYGTGATIDIEGGALNVTGALQGSAVSTTGSTTVGTYVQNGGTVTVAIVNVASDVTTGGKSYGSFDIKAAGSSFTMTGGTIVLQNPTNVSSDYVVGATLGSVTGGLLQVGSAATTIANPYVVTSTTPVFNVTIKGTVSIGTQLRLVGMTINGDLLIETGGKLDAMSHNLSVAGDWTNNGTFTSGTQTTTFNGTNPQTIDGTTSTAFSGLTVNNAAGVTLNTSGSVSAVLTLTTDLTVNEAQLVPALLTQSGTSAGTGDVIGTVRRNDVAGAVQRDFGNPNVEVTIVTGTITTMDVGLTKGSAPPGFGTAIQRVYTLTPGAGALTSATVKLHYLDSELNSNVAGNLTLWRATGTPTGTWTDQGPTGVTRQTASNPNNWVQKTGITGFSSWTLASAPPAAPTAVKLTRFNAFSYSDGVALSWESGFEVNNLGYHLYREQNGVRSRVTPSVIAGSALRVGPGSALTAGYSYSWFDPQGTANSGYYLESIDLNGSRELFGAIYPQSGKGLSPRSQRARLLSEFNEAARDGAALPSLESWASSLPDNARTAKLRLRQQSMNSQFGIAAGPAVKIAVRRSGWYRLTRAELAAAGLDVSVDARLLQLYVDGEEIPIRVSGDGSHLGADDTVEFFGVPLDIPSTDAHVYWLIVGTTPGKRVVVKRNRVKADDQLWSDSSNNSGTFLNTTEIKERISYFPNLLNGDAENIFGPLVTEEPVTENLNITNVDRSVPARMEVEIQGGVDSEHSIEVQLNGTVLGAVNFAGRQHLTATFAVDHAALLEGNNVLSFRALNGDTDIVFVDRSRLTYQKFYRADGNVLQFTMAPEQTVRVVGFTSPHIRVIDITDPNAVSELEPSSGPSGAGYGVRVQNRTSSTRTMLAFTDEMVQVAASVTRNQPSSWNASPNSADLLIVTHRDFRDAIEPLAAQRRSEGLNVAVVDVEDVYDEFGYGAHSPIALKGFLSWAASHWQHAPQYLLLVGDSTFDPRNYLDQGNNDFVPTKLVDTTSMETASDDWLVDFNGDNFADMAVGRLPGRTSSDISLMVSKILAFEHERQLGNPFRGALMVADTGFEAESNQTSFLLPPGSPVQRINRSEVGNDDLARNQIVSAINDGPALVNFYGHGSVQVWTGAGLLDSTLAEGLANRDRLSLFVMMTCLNGYSHDAYIDSLGESLLKAPNGGAVAVWASSGFTDSPPQFSLDSEFYRQVFGGPSIRLGEAIRNAKASVADQDIRQTWVLLGDPTMRIR